MRLPSVISPPLVLVLLAAGLLLMGLSGGSRGVPAGLDAATTAGRAPRVSPDYSGVTIPANIAPLNFVVQEPGQAFFVRIGGGGAPDILVRSDDGRVRIPTAPWRALLQAKRGETVLVQVYVRGASGWTAFEAFELSVAGEDIDGYLCYRVIRPLYNYWRDIEVHQRELAGFRRSMVFDGRKLDEGCVNCHTFAGGKTDRMTLGLRSSRHQDCTLIAHGKAVTRLDQKWGYNNWSNDGRYVALSLNKVRQFFQTGRHDLRDVVDLDSDIVVYNDQTGEVTTCPALSERDRMETYPCWSADGRQLYFCSAPILWENKDDVPPVNWEKVRYDLRRVSFDPSTGQWGKAQVLVSAEKTGKSCLLPRTSPDGRFLLFCMADYGCFPIFLQSSDLYMMDLKSGQYRPLGINSDESESWHSWSSNSRWIAFSSKRVDGLFTRTYLSYIDDTGAARKPFVVPQRDPALYDRLLRTHTFPELVTEPVRTPRRHLVAAGRQGGGVKPTMPETSMTPKQKKDETADPWQQGGRR